MSKNNLSWALSSLEEVRTNIFLFEEKDPYTMRTCLMLVDLAKNNIIHNEINYAKNRIQELINKIENFCSEYHIRKNDCYVLQLANIVLSKLSLINLCPVLTSPYSSF